MKTFFIVGAQRSGTTLLYKLLDDHPEITMSKPMRPESKFFLKEAPYSKEKFRENFMSKDDTMLFGEKSTSYYEFPIAAKRIKQTFPNTKIIFILRNPTQRAISNYFFSKKHGIENRSLEDVFLNKVSAPKLNISISVDPFDYIKRSLYVELLKNFINFFDKSQVKILIFEKLINNDYDLNKELYGYLDVSNFQNNVDLTKTVNASNRDFDVPRNITHYLDDYFKPSILKLEELYGLDCKKWR
jgi:hypothetical protein